MEQKKKQVMFIVNPVSGVKKSQNSIEQIIEANLDASFFDWTVNYTDSADHAFQLSTEAVAAGYDIIASVGGDGTANKVIKGAYGSTSAVAIIPAGSGNGLARFLKIPIDLGESIALINRQHYKHIDTVTVNEELFASIAGVGFDALVARKFAKAGRRGFLTYFRIAMQAYPAYRPRNYKMIIDGVEVRRRALFVSFANSNQFGYNTVIAPDALADDGMMDVCIVKKAPIITAPYILGLLWRNKLDDSGYLEVIRAKEVLLTRNRNRSINLDGEPVKVGKDLKITVNPLTLKVIVP